MHSKTKHTEETISGELEIGKKYLKECTEAPPVLNFSRHSPGVLTHTSLSGIKLDPVY